MDDQSISEAVTCDKMQWFIYNRAASLQPQFGKWEYEK